MKQPQILFELGYQILGFLGLLDQYYVNNALPSKDLLDEESNKLGRVWAMIFKNSNWLEKAEQSGLKPALFGCNLTALYNGERKGLANVALVISDWSGDARFFEQDLFQSMHKHTYNEKTYEVRFDSGIILNIYDAVKCREGIMVASPRKLFEQGDNCIFSTLLYYGERKLRDVEPRYIGGMDGVGPKRLSKVKDICSVKLQFANGNAVYRSFIRLGATRKVMPIRREGSADIIAYRPPLSGEGGYTVDEFL